MLFPASVGFPLDSGPDPVALVTLILLSYTVNHFRYIIDIHCTPLLVRKGKTVFVY